MALERQAKHEIVQFFFNDRYYYFMNSYILDVQQIKEDFSFFSDARNKAKGVLEYATIAQMAEPELYKLEQNVSDSTSNSTARRLLTLDMRSFKPGHRQSGFQTNSAAKVRAQVRGAAPEAAHASKETMYDQYKNFVMSMIELDPVINTSIEELDTFSSLQADVEQGIDNNFQFSDAIEDLRNELIETYIMNYLFVNEYKEVYKVEEQNIWLLGWLLYSREMFDDWSTRPKDMVSSPRILRNINATDFQMLNDYLDDLIEEVTKRALFRDIDNARFGFQIYRGLRFNVTDMSNVTNCTNKELYCPCPEKRDPMDHSYCDPLPKTESLKKPNDTAKSSARILSSVMSVGHVATNTSNTINTTSNEANTSNSATLAQPVKTNKTVASTNPFKKGNENLTQYDEKVEIVPALTPYSAISSLEKSLSTEKDILGFILAYKFIMRNYLFDELLHGYEKQEAPASSI